KRNYTKISYSQFPSLQNKDKDFNSLISYCDNETLETYIDLGTLTDVYQCKCKGSLVYRADQLINNTPTHCLSAKEIIDILNEDPNCYSGNELWSLKTFITELSKLVKELKLKREEEKKKSKAKYTKIGNSKFQS